MRHVFLCLTLRGRLLPADNHVSHLAGASVLGGSIMAVWRRAATSIQMCIPVGEGGRLVFGELVALSTGLLVSVRVLALTPPCIGAGRSVWREHGGTGCGTRLRDGTHRQSRSSRRVGAERLADVLWLSLFWSSPGHDRNHSRIGISASFTPRTSPFTHCTSSMTSLHFTLPKLF